MVLQAIGSEIAKGVFLVFLDAHSIVSPNWLAPLVASLKKTPNSIAYPAVDIIDGDVVSGKMIQGEDAVGAFDWSLRFRWEFTDQKDRLPLMAGRNAAVDEVFLFNPLVTLPFTPVDVIFISGTISSCSWGFRHSHGLLEEARRV